MYFKIFLLSRPVVDHENDDREKKTKKKKSYWFRKKISLKLWIIDGKAS